MNVIWTTFIHDPAVIQLKDLNMIGILNAYHIINPSPSLITLCALTKTIQLYGKEALTRDFSFLLVIIKHSHSSV